MNINKITSNWLGILGIAILSISAMNCIPGITEAKKEDNNGALAGLLLLPAASTAQPTVSVSGVLRDASSNPIAGARLAISSVVGSQRSVEERSTVGTATTTDSNGNRTLTLRVAGFVVSVTSSTGQNLGNMSLVTF